MLCVSGLSAQRLPQSRFPQKGTDEQGPADFLEGFISGRMDGGVGQEVGGLVDGWESRQVDGCMSDWVDVRVRGWILG